MAIVTSSNAALDSVSISASDVYDGPNHDSPPAHTLELSQLEQSNPRGLVRALCFFKLSSHIDPEEAVELFRKGLKPTLQAIPSLACEIVSFDDGKKPLGKIALKHGGFGCLIQNDLRGKGLDYEELQKRNFPQSWLRPADLCAHEVFPKPGEQRPVFVPQLNIIDGGFILTLHCHHSMLRESTKCYEFGLKTVITCKMMLSTNVILCLLKLSTGPRIMLPTSPTLKWVAQSITLNLSSVLHPSILRIRS
jgi:hypothetical protein